MTRSKSKKPAFRIFRQGDVLLIAVGAIASFPVSSKPAARERGKIVLAHGEQTGHAHAIAAKDAKLLVLEDREAMGRAARELLASVGLTNEIRDEDVIGLLELGEEATVQHEEHAPIPLPAGERVLALRQREYSPEEIRQVAD